MLFEYFDLKEEGALIRKAVDASLDANVRTPEIQVEGGDKYGTKEVGAWIVDYLRSLDNSVPLPFCPSVTLTAKFCKPFAVSLQSCYSRAAKQLQYHCKLFAVTLQASFAVLLQKACTIFAVELAYCQIWFFLLILPSSIVSYPFILFILC